MKKILIITDSLGLPRENPEECLYENTWPFLLKNSGFIIHQVSIGGATIDQLFRQVAYHKLFNPDIVIIQSGIVDCAPRALTQFESQFLNKFYISRLALKYLMPRITSSLRKHRKISYTNSDSFEKYILKFKKQFSEIQIFWLGIMPSNMDYERNLPGVTININQYNSILNKNLGHQLLTFDNIRDGLMSDHIHLNALGHKLVFNMLMDKIT